MSVAPTWVVVDDTDPQIIYEGPWTATNGVNYDALGNYGRTYNNSLHGVREQGSMSFSFNGATARSSFAECARISELTFGTVQGLGHDYSGLQISKTGRG